jgi:hypothetical protein
MTEAGRVRFEQSVGPCKGDWCKVKDGSLHRIAHVDASVIMLAASNSFSLDTYGAVGYHGILDRTILRSLLVKKPLATRERGLFNGDQWVNCRVYEEKK